MLLQLLLVIGFNSLDGAKYGLMCVCVCAHKQDCGFADVEGVHVASISLHACRRVHMYAMVCHCLYMCDIHLSRAQLLLCLLQLRGLRFRFFFSGTPFASRDLVVYVGLPM